MSFREEMAKEMSDLLARWVEGFVVGTTDVHNQKIRTLFTEIKQNDLVEA